MKLLRAVVLFVGLVAMGIGGLVVKRVRVVEAREAEEAAALPPTPVVEDYPLTSRVRRARTVLAAAGIAVAVFGAGVLLRTVPWPQYLIVAIWLAGAIILHDGVLVPAVTLLRTGAHRAGGRLPSAAVGIVTSGFVVAGLLSVVVLPEIWAQHRGTGNPTVLPGNYPVRLLVAWGIVAAATLLGAAVLSARRFRHWSLGAPVR